MNRQVVIIILLVIIGAGSIAYLKRENQALALELKRCRTHHSPDGSSCPNCYPDSCGTYPFIDINLAANLVKNYRQNHWRAANSNVQPFASQTMSNNTDPEGVVLDSRSSWYSLQDLKLFIKTIENITCDSNCSPKPRLGIRIYYGEYPNDTFGVTKYGYDVALAPDLMGKHTLLMVPTYHDNGSNFEVDFDPANFRCPGSSIFDTTLIPTGSMPALLPARNHGGLRPPPYKATDYWFNSGATFMMYADWTDYIYSSNGFNYSIWPTVHL